MKKTEVDSAGTDSLEAVDAKHHGALCLTRPRSLVWTYFTRLHSLSSAQCNICLKKIKCSDGGTTGNLHRHLSTKHPEVSSQQVLRREKTLNSSHVSTTTSDTSSPPETDRAAEQSGPLVIVVLEDGNSEAFTEVNTAEIESAMKYQLELPRGAKGASGEKTPHEELHFAHVSSRTRSLIWKYFKRLEGLSASQCQICLRKIKCADKSTSNLHRHISKKHPEIFSQQVPWREKTTLSNSSHVTKTSGDTSAPETDGAAEQSGPAVIVVLEEGNSEAFTEVNTAEIESAVKYQLELPREAKGASGEKTPHEELRFAHVSSRTRSLIWKYFKRLEGLSASQCQICLRKIKCADKSTSNLHRHISKKHPDVCSQQVPWREKTTLSNSSHVTKTSGDTSAPPETDGAAEQSGPAVEVVLENRASGEQTPHEELRFVHVSSRTRSLIWNYYKRLEGLTASQCQICFRKIKCPDKSTSNLHRHISKKHPVVFSQLMAQRNKSTPSNSSHISKANGDTSRPPETEEEEQREQSVPSVFDGGMHVFRTEQELIEALRRAMKEEAQALERQREILEKLRAVNDREAAEQKEQIQSLRKAQEEEARDLNRQRDELQKEKAELQKKWEELLQERQQCLLVCSGQNHS